MDVQNIQELNKLKPQGSKATIELLGKYDPQRETIIRDPYYVYYHSYFILIYVYLNKI